MHCFTLLFLSLISLSLAPFALAQNGQPITLRITGAQAFRGVTHTAIQNILTAGYSYGFQGTSLGSANAAIFTGRVGTQDVIIKTAWTGSTAGIRTVAASIPVNFLADNTPQSPGGASGAGAATDNSIPDVAATDSEQAATIYTNPTLRDIPVGVAPYVFVANADAPAALDNITSQTATALFKAGKLSLSLFTGDPAHENIPVYAVGRDPDSGARLIVFVEAGIGIFTAVNQHAATVSGATITGFNPWPAEPVGGVNYNAGESGYGSFGALGTVLTKTSFQTSGAYFVSYMPVPDALYAVNAGTGTRILKYNGVSYSAANVANGAYAIWGYEHLMHRTTLDDTRKAIVNTLAQQLIDKDATVLLGTMNVKRDHDGSVIRPK